MVASGMAAAGYEYVNIDDCWMAPERDARGRLQSDPHRFPSGINALGEYAHAGGLKLGIYASAGTATCQHLPGSLDHEAIDAVTFAQWGVDLLKYDNCYNQDRPAIERYQAMADALEASGRDIVYSVCEWGDSEPWTWADKVGGHYWRTYGDISDNWARMVDILDQQVGLESFSGPNGWNDPDMLEVGNGGMSTEEYRAQMSLWAMLNAPLIAGNDLRSMDTVTHDLLTNSEVLAVDQDWAGSQGRKIADEGLTEIWAKPISSGGVAIVFFNRGTDDAVVYTRPSTDLDLPFAHAHSIRDLWTGSEQSLSAGLR